MLEYRKTPISGLRYAPAQLAMSRLLRSKLPTSRSVLQPRVVNAKPDLQERQQRMKRDYDRGATSLKPITSGDAVRVQTCNRALHNYRCFFPSWTIPVQESSLSRRKEPLLSRRIEPLLSRRETRCSAVARSRCSAAARSRCFAAARTRCSAVARSRCYAAASSRCSTAARSRCSAATRNRRSAAARSRRRAAAESRRRAVAKSRPSSRAD